MQCGMVREWRWWEENRNCCLGKHSLSLSGIVRSSRCCSLSIIYHPPPHNSNLVIVAAGNDLSFTTYAIWLHRVAKDSAPSVLSPPHVRKNDRDLVNLSAQDTGNSDSHRQCISALRCATPPCSPALEM